MKQDFLIFKQYYKQAIEKLPTDSFFYQNINHKFKHSVDVLHIGQQIMAHTPELQTKNTQFRDIAEKSLLFHDLGRFKEALNNYNNEKKHLPSCLHHYDHGLIGYNILKKNPSYNDERILFSLRYHGKIKSSVTRALHNKTIQNSPLKQDITDIVNLVRDADKLANLKVIKKDNHLTKDLFYRNLTKDARVAPLSEKVKQQFIKKQTIRYGDLHSYADRILMILSWIFDLNYQYTQKLFTLRGYDKYLLRELSRFHPNKKDLALIKTITANQLKQRNK